MSCVIRMHLAPLWSAATGRSDTKRLDQRRGGAKPRPMRTRSNQVIHVAYTPVKKRITRQTLPHRPLVDQLLKHDTTKWWVTRLTWTTRYEMMMLARALPAPRASAVNRVQQQYHRHTCLPMASTGGFGHEGTCSCVRGTETVCACGSAQLPRCVERQTVSRTCAHIMHVSVRCSLLR